MRSTALAFLLALPFALPLPAWAQAPFDKAGRPDGAEPGQYGAARPIEPTGPINLDTAMGLAYRANPELSAAERELQALEASITQAAARPNPELSALLEDTRTSTRVTTLQVSQPLELGGKRAARIEAAERGRDAASAERDAKRAEIGAAVKAAFFNVLAAQERMRIAQASVELAQSVTTAASRRVAAGKVSPVEETKARIAEAGVRVESTLAASELASARKRLASLWGNPAPRFERAEGDLEALPPLPAIAELNARLLASPSLVRARMEVERRAALAGVERSRAMPNVTVSLGARRDEELGRDQAILGVSIPIPVFDRNQGNLLEALHRVDKARDELSATELRLSDELALAHERLNTARSETESLRRDILPGAESAFNAANRGFELGKFSFLEVLDAQRTLFQAKSRYLRVLAETHRSAAEIERVLGGATAAPSSAPIADKP